METKVCNTCNEEKPISNFHKFRNGVRNYCSKCSTELIKKYREENPEWYEKTKETHRIKKRGRTKEERHEDNLKKRAWRRNVSIDIILEEERISELAESQNKKYCYDCKTILNKEYFGKHKQAKDGLNTKIRINFELPYYNLHSTIFVWLALTPLLGYHSIYTYGSNNIRI